MTSPRRYWLLTVAGRWHAWHVGGRKSVCGTLNVESLRAQPPKDMQDDLPATAEAATCRICLRRAGAAVTVAAGPDRVTAAWSGYVARHVERVGGRLAATDVLQLATLLAQVGAPEQPEAQAVWRDVQALLLTPWRRRSQQGGRAKTVITFPGVHAALQVLAPHAGALRLTAAALACWRKITGRTLATERYHPEQVVKVVLQLPTVEPYVRHLHARGLDPLAAMFHPNTLARAQREASLRGAFGGSGDYWQRTLDQLTVVTD